MMHGDVILVGKFVQMVVASYRLRISAEIVYVQWNISSEEI